VTASARLLLDQSQKAALAAAAEAAWPEECCGLLVGRHLAAADGGQVTLAVTRLVPAANRHPEPRHGFDLDPATHFALLRELRDGAGGETILGHYHSHPEGPAQPSPRDAAQAWDADMVWLIVGLTGGRTAVITAWMVTDPAEPDTPGRFAELPLAGA